jgi:hypothetical protein
VDWRCAPSLLYSFDGGVEVWQVYEVRKKVVIAVTKSERRLLSGKNILSTAGH